MGGNMIHIKRDQPLLAVLGLAPRLKADQPLPVKELVLGRGPFDVTEPPRDLPHVPIPNVMKHIPHAVPSRQRKGRKPVCVANVRGGTHLNQSVVHVWLVVPSGEVQHRVAKLVLAVENRLSRRAEQYSSLSPLHLQTRRQSRREARFQTVDEAGRPKFPQLRPNSLLHLVEHQRRLHAPGCATISRAQPEHTARKVGRT